MPTRAALDVGEVSRRGHEIEQIDDVQRRRDPECRVVQSRPATVRESHVVDAALSMHPGGPQHAAVLVFRVFGDAESHLVVEGDRSVDVGRKTVEMVDPQRLHTVVEPILLMDRRKTIHLVIEF